MANLWAGRFERGMDGIVEEFNASIGFDKRMYNCDIDGSIAHVFMLSETGIVTERERDDIVSALEDIRNDIAGGRLALTVKQEDIHMAVEEALIARIGATGKKLHTARSRNDQSQTDVRLFFMRETVLILDALVELQRVILEKADVNIEELLVGFTHMQHAQPVTAGFHLMAYFQMFRRDIERLIDTRRRANQNPLGAGALGGTTFDIDRNRTTELLGFDSPCENAMDAVSDRDYIIEFLSGASISMMHVSRFAEEIVYWNSSEFGFISIDDSFCTGSSMMPQKKNPDIAELLRGKVGRVYGDLITLLTVMKGTPLSFNKDFQEDKEPLFDAIDVWRTSVSILAAMIEKMEYRSDEIQKHLAKGFLCATDMADSLVRQGIPFRDSHWLVGKMVKLCESKSCDMSDLSLEDLISLDPRFESLVLPDLSMMGCVSARKTFGGTAPSEVKRQIEVGRKWLATISEKSNP
ncbi:MAG: argininosuccinate lyase [Synergistaceae bacterium]|jgi:argininosuccinate lyase|nr:argininosuccinate lyase [Synergistaceae bacterium]